jgi:hypothetical protein
VARGKRRLGRVLLILTLAGLLLLVIADRVGLVVAERTVASQAADQLRSEGVTITGDPSVTIHGIPFLTQVTAGYYHRIDITVKDPTNRGVRLDTLDVTATGVHAPARSLMAGNAKIEADRIAGTAQVSWGSFAQMVDLGGLSQYGVDPSTIQIVGTDSGHINLTAPVSVAGASFTALATGTVTVADDILHVVITDISAADGDLPANVATQLAAIEQQLTFAVRIPPLPYHLVVDSVNTSAAGVTITASAAHVVLG